MTDYTTPTALYVSAAVGILTTVAVLVFSLSRSSKSSSSCTATCPGSVTAKPSDSSSLLVDNASVCGLSVTDFRPFPITGVEQLLDDVHVITIAHKAPTEILHLAPGRHVQIQHPTDAKVKRYYTPIRTDLGHLSILFRHYPDGALTPTLFNSVVGDQVMLRGPNGKWVYEANRYHTVCMLAGGTGITPMLQVIQAMAAAHDDKTRAILLFSNKHAHSIVEYQLLEKYAAEHSFLDVHYFVTQDSSDVQQVVKLRNGYVGRITRESLASLCPAPRDDLLVLCCGPLPFNKSMREAVLALGHSPKNFHKF